MNNKWLLGIKLFLVVRSNIPESPAYGVFVSQLICYARICSKYEYFLLRGSILVSKSLKRDILHGNFRLLFGNYMVVIQTLFTNLTPLCHIYWMVCSLTVTYDWFPVIWVNRDGYHMWGRKCSLFPEHLIHSLWGVHEFTHSLYIFIYSTNHVYLHRPNAFGFWQTRLHLCYETLKRVSNFSELA